MQFSTIFHNPYTYIRRESTHVDLLRRNLIFENIVVTILTAAIVKDCRGNLRSSGEYQFPR